MKKSKNIPTPLLMTEEYRANKKISVIKTKYGYEATCVEGTLSLSILRNTKEEAIRDLTELWNEK